MVGWFPDPVDNEDYRTWLWFLHQLRIRIRSHCSGPCYIIRPRNKQRSCFSLFKTKQTTKNLTRTGKYGSDRLYGRALICLLFSPQSLSFVTILIDAVLSAGGGRDCVNIHEHHNILFLYFRRVQFSTYYMDPFNFFLTFCQLAQGWNFDDNLTI